MSDVQWSAFTQGHFVRYEETEDAEPTRQAAPSHIRVVSMLN